MHALFDARHLATNDLAVEVLRGFGALRLGVTGSSMLPAIRPADTILVHPCSFDEAELHDKIPVTVDEAVTNAIKHGNKFQEDKKVYIDIHIDVERIKIVVADEGPGFDVKAVPDPTDPANFLKPSGRGILFMSIGMDDQR